MVNPFASRVGGGVMLLPLVYLSSCSEGLTHHDGARGQPFAFPYLGVGHRPLLGLNVLLPPEWLWLCLALCVAPYAPRMLARVAAWSLAQAFAFGAHSGYRLSLVTRRSP